MLDQSTVATRLDHHRPKLKNPIKLHRTTTENQGPEQSNLYFFTILEIFNIGLIILLSIPKDHRLLEDR